MGRKNTSALIILGGVILISAVIFVVVNSPGSAGQSASAPANPAIEDTPPTADAAAIERGPGTPHRGEESSGRRLAGAESDEQPSDEDASVVAQKKKSKKKRRQRRSQDGESTADDASGAPDSAKLPPASIMEGDH